MNRSRQGKEYARHFITELEKEVRVVEKKDPFNGEIFRKIVTEIQGLIENDWEFALFTALENLEYYSFLSVKPETMKLI